MNKVTRYVVRMKNGDYLRQDFDHLRLDTVRIWSVDNPIDSDLFRSEKEAERLIKEVLSGSTNLLVIYQDDNPPEQVEELEINFTKK
ncbi:hypothetical protein [Bacillus sp. AG4(2022)]|uniref:hypothetical protein n=1 Tax=Bacillus sp. AG4(2022) TaxID=2962594 RepID=UPI0028812CE1|nr:hypothetical protein [Bacillus sp. AG4(2022)]MDT0160377.1 hypothetical protein [Bacillus sp. AG4(2022)]